MSELASSHSQGIKVLWTTLQDLVKKKDLWAANRAEELDDGLGEARLAAAAIQLIQDRGLQKKTPGKSGRRSSRTEVHPHCRARNTMGLHSHSLANISATSMDVTQELGSQGTSAAERGSLSPPDQQKKHKSLQTGEVRPSRF